MANVFKIATSVYGTATGYVASPFIPASLIKRKGNTEASPFEKGECVTKATDSITGSNLLRKYKGGIYYFMPVELIFEGTTWIFNDAVVSISGKKTIVETPLVGVQGTVKELISIRDYEIKLVAIVSGDDYPEEELQEIVKLFEINENIVIKCAVTNYFLKDEDKVVITSIDFPAMEGEEDSQAITMTLVSDQNFELEL